MEKYEWRKSDKAIYLPKNSPVLTHIPTYNYYTIEGEGNPNDASFSAYIEVLYALSYGVRMVHKTAFKPQDYYEYTVFPLEGIWDLMNPSLGFSKDNLKYKLMIRQPDFVDEVFANENLKRVKAKKSLPLLDKVKFEAVSEGKVVQMMHSGSFDDEALSFAIIDEFLKQHNLIRTTLVHKEIYISDFRKTSSDKLKTILRVYVK